MAVAAILAAGHPGAVGEAYNVTDQGPITQREYLRLWAEASGGPAIRRRHSYTAVWGVAFAMEAFGRLARSRRPPLITRYATWLMARDLSYSTAKARTVLGWAPATGYRETIERTIRWYDASRSFRTP